MAQQPTPSTTAQEPPLSVVLIPKPLTAKAMALRRPEAMMLRNVEYAEEGDILFPIQQQETHQGTLWGPTPSLCYPTAVSQAFVGEMFRAIVIFRNSASYPLTRLHVRVELVTPSTTRTTIFDGVRANEISPYGHHDMRIETRLREAGSYRLSIATTAMDITGEKKVLSLHFNIPVEVAFEEVEHVVSYVPTPLSSQLAKKLHQAQQSAIVASSEHDPSLRNAIVSFTLLNKSSEPLTLTDVRFVAKEGSTALYTLLGPSQGRQGDTQQQAHLGSVLKETLPFRHRFTGGGGDPPESMHMRAGDKRQFLFELHPLVDRVAGGKEDAAAMRHVTIDLGYVQWEWRRANGDGGSDVSVMMKGMRPSPQPEITFFVSVSQATTPATAATTTPADSAAASEPTTTGGAATPSNTTNAVTALSKCSVRCVVTNNHPKRRRDLMLLVDPDALLKEHWHYTGPCSRLLGVADPSGGDVDVALALTPMHAGILPLPSNAFQVRDATNPEILLWSSANAAAGAATSGGGGSSPSPATGTVPVLCQVSVIGCD